MNQPLAARNLSSGPAPRRTRHARFARRALAASIMAAFGAAPPARAQLPTGAQVVNGSAQIAVSGSQMTITNSPNAVLNWQAFSVGATNGVRFEQESAASKVLNRVTGTDPSSILGSLSSNGEVWLVNPYGVVFGNNSRVDVGALVATTLGVANDDFVSGRLAFGASAVPGGQVLNQGAITTSFGGRMWLLGDSVRNEGSVNSPGGRMVLAAGKSIDLVDSGVPNVTVRVSAPENTAVNLGTLLAPGGGSIDLHGAIVNQDGIVRADTLGYEPGGRIVIKAKGDVQLGAGSQTSVNADDFNPAGHLLIESATGTTIVEGSATATNPRGVGGRIHVLGRQVDVRGTAVIDASGATSGGEVLLGGDSQGANAAVLNALNTSVGAATTIRANATASGDGGRIVVWADDTTRVLGALEAMGGQYGGVGGTIDTAGLFLAANPRLDVSGPEGNGGTWMLGAGSIRIDTAIGVNVHPGAIVEALARGAKVRVQAGVVENQTQGGNLVVAAPVTIPFGGLPLLNAALTLEARNDIIVNAGAGIVAERAPIPMTLTADLDGDGMGGIDLQDGARIVTKGGDLLLGGGAGGLGSAAQIAMQRTTLDAGAGNLAMVAASVELSGSGSFTGNEIYIAADRVQLQSATINARANAASSGILIESPSVRLAGGSLAASIVSNGNPTLAPGIRIAADQVALTDIDLNAVGQVNISAGASLTTANARLSALAGGDAIVLSTVNLSTSASTLSTPNGRWLIRLGAGLPALPATELNALGYTFVQVNAGEGATPVRSGIGQHGVLVADPVYTYVKVNADRNYDGTTQATFSRALAYSSMIPGLILDPNDGNFEVQAQFQDRLAGVDKPIVYEGNGPVFGVVTSTGQAVFGVQQSYFGDIRPKALGATLAAENKVYDATRVATLSGSLSPAGVIEGDDVSLGAVTGWFDTKDAGGGKSVTLSGAVLTGADANNYTLATPAVTFADITPRPISATGVYALDKVYDGTRAAVLSGLLAEPLAGDIVSLDGASGLFADKNVGVDKRVDLTGGVLGGRDAANYSLAMPAFVNAAITHRPLTIAMAGAVLKQYDGTTLASLAGNQFQLNGMLAAEPLSVTGPAEGSFDSKNVGQQKLVTARGVFAISGAQLSNYSVGAVPLSASVSEVDASVSAGVGTITPKPVNAALVAANKVYDGTRTATLFGSLPGMIAGDRVSLDGATGLFDSKDAGVGKSVALSGALLTGADANNYTLTTPAAAFANITPRPIGVTGLNALDKVYDGTRAAVLSGSLSEKLPGDIVTLDGARGLFGDKDVGAGKRVDLTGGVLGGRDAANYSLTAPAFVNAAITHRPLEIAMAGAVLKQYDGTTLASFAGNQFQLNGMLATEPLSVTGPAQGSFDSRNVGQQKLVTASGAFIISGAQLSNYSVAAVPLLASGSLVHTSVSAGVGTVTPKPVNAALVAADKVYDGTRMATLSGSVSGLIAGDSVILDGATGLFDTKHAGTAKTVTLAGAQLAGVDARNYTLSSSATTLANIAPRLISATGIVAADKVYDGTRTAQLSGALSGAIPGDTLSLDSLAGLFDSKNVGLNKAIAITGMLGGLDAANYTLSTPSTVSAAILHRPVEIAIAGEVRKQYDATALASFGPGQFSLTGVLANETVAVTGPAQGSFDSPNVGQQKQVSASGTFEITGADAANYRLGPVALAGVPTRVAASASAHVGTITPATLVYHAAPAEGAAGAPATSLTGSVTGFKGSDQLANASSGALQWTSPATPASPPGAYPVNGSGLAAPNYVFVQHGANATALNIKFNETVDQPRQVTQDSSTLALNTAVEAALPAIDPQPRGGGVFDRSGPAAAGAFGTVAIGSMNQSELGQMLERRKEFKRKLFADAIYKLEINPNLADVRPCVTIAEASSGACRITTAQLDEIHSTRALAQAQASAKKSRPKTASVPQIERKIAVLFGVNDYQDKTIPRLENAISDVDTIGRLFADKLGYEVQVLHNPAKADIIRTMNELATRVNASDSVVIYYAGHGYAPEKEGAGYWLATDANTLEPGGWISNNDVARMLTSIRSRQMTLISDSCYSGNFAREGLGAVGQDVKVEDVLAKRSVVVLSSGGDEPVADEGRDGHSIFAWHLMQSIGSIKDWKQGSKIFTEVQSRVKKEFPQTPKYSSVTEAGHQAGGDYLFELRSK